MRTQRHLRPWFLRSTGRVAALALVVSGTLALSPDRASAVPAPVSVAAVYSGRGDGGLSESFIDRKGSYERFDVSGSVDSGVVVDLQSPDGYRYNYRVQFAAPAGQSLQVGSYSDARPLFNRADGQAGFQVGDQYNCPAGVGQFQFLDLAADLSKFRVVFSYRCSPSAQATFGEIRYNMPGDSEFAVSATRIAFPEATFDEGERSVRVKLMNTGPNPVNVTGVQLAGPGTAAFRTVDGCSQHPLERLSWCWIDVTYNAVVATPQSATVTIQTTEFGSHSIELSGPGLSPDDPVFSRSVGADPDPVYNVSATPKEDGVTFTWSPPRNVDFVDTVLRFARGTTPPATPTAGIEGYAGPARTATISGLDPGTPYSFSLFARDAEGRYSVPWSQTIGGVKISVNVNRKALNYGDDLVITGYLSDAESGRPIEFANVTVLAYDPVDGQYALVAEDKAYAGGAYQVALKPGQNYQYVVVYDGDYSHLGSFTFGPRVTVAMGLHLQPVRKFVTVGQPMQLWIFLEPLNPGQNVVLERQQKGKWKKFKSYKVGKKSPLKVSIKAREGTYNWRVRRVGDRRHSAGTSNRVVMQVLGKPDP